MKKIVIVVLLVLAGAAAQAQDRLEPVTVQTDDHPFSLLVRFYEQETWRLLNPRNANWGVLCLPSFRSESSIVYDETAKALVYSVVEGTTLWRTLNRAIEEEFPTGMGDFAAPKNYQVPAVKTAVLPISGRLAEKLERLWNTALAKTEENSIHGLDGCEWQFFADGKQATARYPFPDGWTRIPRLIRLLKDFEHAIVSQGHEALGPLEQEVDALQRLFEESLGTAPEQGP